MFGPSKQRSGGSEVQNGEEVKMVFDDWVQMLEPDLFRVRICKFMPSLDKRINFLVALIVLLQNKELHLML